MIAVVLLVCGAGAVSASAADGGHDRAAMSATRFAGPAPSSSASSAKQPTTTKRKKPKKNPACTSSSKKKKKKRKPQHPSTKVTHARRSGVAVAATTRHKVKPKGSAKNKKKHKKPTCRPCPPPCKAHHKCKKPPARCKKPPAKPHPPSKSPPPPTPTPPTSPPSAPGLGPIGAPGPAVACTETLSVGASIESALSRAGPGTVVCLSPGNYGNVTLTGIAPTANVTLAPVPGGSVTFSELTLSGSANANLTIQGFNIPGGVQDVSATPGGLVFQYNTISHNAAGYGFYFDADGNGGNNTQYGVQILHNEIDYVGECLAVTRGTDQEHTFTFSGNVCGPGIGYGDQSSTDPGHYIEIGGVTGISVDSNAFVGPADPNDSNIGLHLNVFHVFGDSSDVDFSNNLLWHTQTIGQALLIQEGHFDDVTINNNLDVEDPSCDNGNSNCTSYAFWTTDVHGLSFQDNTVVDSYWGVILTIYQTSQDYKGGTNYTVAHNIGVGTADNSDLSYGDCTSACVFDYNVTDDPSAHQGGSTHYVTSWAPHWATTSWAPTVPYARPPAGYYQPVGLPFSAGYQGTAGP